MDIPQCNICIYKYTADQISIKSKQTEDLHVNIQDVKKVLIYKISWAQQNQQNDICHFCPVKTKVSLGNRPV